MQYILVHGSWHGAWCWQKLVPYLEEKGHQVECVDLPGPNTGYDSVTYQDYYDHLATSICRYDEPVVLVAHSMSGIIAGPLADHLSERIIHAYFIAAFMPKYGDSLLDTALKYDQSEIPEILHVDLENQVHTLNTMGAKETLYHDCTTDIKEWAVKQLSPQPIAPIETPMTWEDSNRTSHKRTYIICELDRDVAPDLQRDTVQLHPSRIISLKSGHFPFLSQPEKLADILLNF